MNAEQHVWRIDARKSPESRKEANPPDPPNKRWREKKPLAANKSRLVELLRARAPSTIPAKSAPTSCRHRQAKLDLFNEL